jgi:hypothetical protein
MAADALDEYIETLAPAGARQASAVIEETFLVLKWVEQTGEKLGSYETADKKDNLGDAWQSAFNILQKSEATISKRYHGPQYGFAYWLFGERIFRQRLKKQV